ncbi:MAG: FMN-binding protein [Actinomycetota bacterium]|nr:FMN-binding protein [Actinomycetota bacterium]
MTVHLTQRSRRGAALVGLFGAVGLLVSAKELAGPSSSVLSSTAGPRAPSSTGSPAPTAGPSPSASTPPPSSPSASPAPTTPTTVSGIRRIAGNTENNPYGPIQVRITLKAGKLVDVTALQSPTDHSTSVAIAQQALPLLRQEVLQAQGAHINNVSGASYDALGYAQSVQSALDKARTG